MKAQFVRSVVYTSLYTFTFPLIFKNMRLINDINCYLLPWSSKYSLRNATPGCMWHPRKMGSAPNPMNDLTVHCRVNFLSFFFFLPRVSPSSLFLLYFPHHRDTYHKRCFKCSVAGCTANLLKGYFLDGGKLYCTEHDPAATVSLGGCRKCNQPVSLVVSVSRTQFSDLFFSYTPHDVCMHSNSLSPWSLLEPSLAYFPPPPTASSTANYLLSHPLPFSIIPLSFLPVHLSFPSRLLPAR